MEYVGRVHTDLSRNNNSVGGWLKAFQLVLKKSYNSSLTKIKLKLSLHVMKLDFADQTLQNAKKTNTQIVLSYIF